MAILQYGEKELNYLSEKDETMAKAIAEIGFIERDVNPNLFQALTGSILSQQISGKAADTIWNRLLELAGDVNAQRILDLSDEDLRQCGISARKIDYIKGVAIACCNGELKQEDFETMDDEQIIQRLVSIKGVGKWTAEMLLIFSMGRKNILSFGDLGIKKGIAKLYGYTDVNEAQLKIHKEVYSPYATIASFYLWEMASRK